MQVAVEYTILLNRRAIGAQSQILFRNAASRYLSAFVVIAKFGWKSSIYHVTIMMFADFLFHCVECFNSEGSRCFDYVSPNGVSKFGTNAHPRDRSRRSCLSNLSPSNDWKHHRIHRCSKKLTRGRTYASHDAIVNPIATSEMIREHDQRVSDVTLGCVQYSV